MGANNYRLFSHYREKTGCDSIDELVMSWDDIQMDKLCMVSHQTNKAGKCFQQHHN